MFRKIVAASVLIVGLSTGTAGIAAAQDSPPPSVSPTTVQVQGEVVLPKTGSDIGIDVIAGVSLTAAGLAFAAAARQRRRRAEVTPAAS
jgi:LPXTG-motif cell wall-anchored protein